MCTRHPNTDGAVAMFRVLAGLAYSAPFALSLLHLLHATDSSVLEGHHSSVLTTVEKYCISSSLINRESHLLIWGVGKVGALACAHMCRMTMVSLTAWLWLEVYFETHEDDVSISSEEPTDPSAAELN
jgi:hypothetical protein